MAIAVALCGFNDTEHRLFDGIFRVSATRGSQYSRWQDTSPDTPQIYLVKQGKDEGVARWQELTEVFSNVSAPILEIGDRSTEGWKQLARRAGRDTPQLLKPISATRLLDALDELIASRTGSGTLLGDDVSMDEIGALDSQVVGTANSRFRGKVALVVDDSASLRLQMDITLNKKLGMRADFAADGATAVKKFQLGSYDIVFLDVMLPDTDGFSICKQIRREFHSKVPVVMLTSRDGRRDQLKGVLVQADDYLIKPVAAEKLEQTLEKYLTV
jgi:CheY-like chemotaxis protein